MKLYTNLFLLMWTLKIKVSQADLKIPTSLSLFQIFWKLSFEKIFQTDVSINNWNRSRNTNCHFFKHNLRFFFPLSQSRGFYFHGSLIQLQSLIQTFICLKNLRKICKVWNKSQIWTDQLCTFSINVFPIQHQLRIQYYGLNILRSWYTSRFSPMN